jgi:hypothetical protein
MYLNSAIDHINIINKYTSLHSKTAEYFLFFLGTAIKLVYTKGVNQASTDCKGWNNSAYSLIIVKLS